MEIKIPDLTKVHWQLNIALVGVVFSIFALIYSDKYIYYGLFTFVYGVMGVSILPAIEGLFPNNKWRNYLVIQTTLTVLWLVSCSIIGLTRLN